MKKVCFAFLGMFFLVAGFASDALAHREGGRGVRRFGEGREYRRHDHHHHHHRWNNHPHSHGWYRSRRRYYNYDRWYYEPYYYGGYYPGVVVRFDPFGWLFSPPPTVVVKERVVEVEKRDPGYDEETVSGLDDGGGSSELEDRLEKLRTWAARDFLEKKPMPYREFDRMTPPERRAYGEEWDRHMLLEGGKGPFFKKSLR